MHRFKIRMDTMTVESLWRQRHEIDFEPVYQRKGNIWSVSSRQYLIDSIINGFDVPKIYLADFSYGITDLNRTSQRYAVIDGKQRMLAIFGYMEEAFRLSPSFEYFDDPSIDVANFSFPQLRDRHPEIAYRFMSFQLVIMEVSTDDEAKINDLFVRLNSSKPLTGSELRNAMLGPVPELIRSIVQRSFFRECLPFRTLRSEDKNLAAKLLLIEHRGAPVDTKRRQLDALVQEARGVDERAAESALQLFGETENVDLQGSGDRLFDNLSTMEAIFIHKDPLLRQSSQIPVFYWFIREIADRDIVHVREFLLSFQDDRRKNAAAAREGAPTDPELDRFELVTRSSNDAGSIKQRHLILAKRWSAFLAARAENAL